MLNKCHPLFFVLFQKIDKITEESFYLYLKINFINAPTIDQALIHLKIHSANIEFKTKSKNTNETSDFEIKLVV